MNRWNAKNFETATRMVTIGRRIWTDRHWYVTCEGCNYETWVVVAD